jgi:thioredoxin 1
MTADNQAGEPTREQVNQLTGLVLLEFGAEWCEFCQALRPQLARLLESHPKVQHIRVEDGKGKPLGRSFRVKLWPTLVFIRDGTVIKQMARPGRDDVREGLEALEAPAHK